MRGGDALFGSDELAGQPLAQVFLLLGNRGEPLVGAGQLGLEPPQRPAQRAGVGDQAVLAREAIDCGEHARNPGGEHRRDRIGAGIERRVEACAIEPEGAVAVDCKAKVAQRARLARSSVRHHHLPGQCRQIAAQFARAGIAAELAAEAGEAYVTLAVGDALVAQVPALLLSIAAAAIVTRVSDQRDLAGQIGGQFADPRGWLPVALILGAVGVVPAMPQMIFLPAAAIAGAIWWQLKRYAAASPPPPEPVAEPAADAIALADVSDQTLVTIELGYGIIGLVDEEQGAPLITRITGIRKQLSRDLGFVLPQFRIRDSLDLGAQDYAVLMGGVSLARGTVRPGKLLAIDAGEVRNVPYAELGLTGEPTRDPSFDCPALWITPAAREHAIAEGFLVVDPATVIATHTNQALLAEAHQLLGPDEVREWVGGLKARAPALVEAVTPEPLSLPALTRTLRALVADGIGLAHPQPLFTSLALALQKTLDFDAVIDAVRADLGARLIARIAAPGEPLKVVTLDAGLESAILGGMIDPATGQPLIEPECGGMIAREINAIADAQGGPVALIVQPPARRALAALLRQRAPRCLVLSIAELPPTQPIAVVGVIGEAASAQTPALAAPPATEPV